MKDALDSRLGNRSVIQKLAKIARKNNYATRLGDLITRPEWIMNTVTSRYPIGTNVFDYQWDLLIILDTCRVDAIRAVSDEFSFITDIDSITSVGSASREWVQKTFVKEYEQEISNTAYVTANPWIERVVDNRQYLDKGKPRWTTVSTNSIGHIEHVWKLREEMGKRAHPEGTAAPELVTDVAIQSGRKLDFDRMIVHYVPPHHSYVANALEGRPLNRHESDPFQYLREGNSRKKVWNSYLDELRWGLEWVNVLISNIDAPKTIITSDHGEAFGEFGRYMHDPSLIVPAVKNVPWVETTASDKETRKTTNYDIEASSINIDTKDQLSAMGYV